MTPQQILDFVYLHLSAQRTTSFNDDMGICAYFDPSGNKCAVGCLLPDTPVVRAWAEYCEGLSATDLLCLLRNEKLHKETQPPAELVQWGKDFGLHEELLSVLQSAHDSQYFNVLNKGGWNQTEFNDAIDIIAKEYNLQFPANRIE